MDADHPVLERFETAAEALTVFREGTSMSKGTTTSTGLTHSYFANIFGPPQYRELHETLAARYFDAFFRSGIYVGQLRTRLGIHGCETSGPAEAATHLLGLITSSGAPERAAETPGEQAAGRRPCASPPGCFTFSRWPLCPSLRS